MIKKYDIPVWPARLFVGVSRNPERERRSMDEVFGPVPDSMSGWRALTSCSNDGRFGIFFGTRGLSIDEVAHEVFHVTHRILEWSHANFDPDHHEQGAYLHGHLFDLTYKQVKRYLK